VTVVGSCGVACRDWFVRKLSGALDALGVMESSRGPVDIALVTRGPVNAVGAKGVVVAIERWRRYWLSRAVIRLSSVSNDWQEAVSSV
jgi:hypothetical protein